jgi:hypothetical protein
MKLHKITLQGLFHQAMKKGPKLQYILVLDNFFF